MVPCYVYANRKANTQKPLRSLCWPAKRLVHSLIWNLPSAPTAYMLVFSWPACYHSRPFMSNADEPGVDPKYDDERMR